MCSCTFWAVLCPYLIFQNLVISDEGEHLYREMLVLGRKLHFGVAHREEYGGVAITLVLAARRHFRTLVLWNSLSESSRYSTHQWWCPSWVWMCHLHLKWPSSYPTRAPGLGQMTPESHQSTVVPSDISLLGILHLCSKTGMKNLWEELGQWTLHCGPLSQVQGNFTIC